MLPEMFFKLKRALLPLMHEDTYDVMNGIVARIENANRTRGRADAEGEGVNAEGAVAIGKQSKRDKKRDANGNQKSSVTDSSVFYIASGLTSNKRSRDNAQGSRSAVVDVKDVILEGFAYWRLCIIEQHEHE